MMSKFVSLPNSSNPSHAAPNALMRASLCCAVVLVLSGGLRSLDAQSNAQPGTTRVQTSSTEAPLPVAAAAEATGSINIDGKLDEAAWSRATPITDFHQQQPKEGAAPSQRTEVRVLFDEHALYIGARMYDSLGKGGIRAPVSRRDQLLDSNGNNGSFNSLTTDKLIVMLDPYHNKIDQAWFEVNPAGVRGDQFNGDPWWDPIWEGAK